MKSIQLSFDWGGHKTPSFSEWYSENSTEKRKYSEPTYTPSEAEAVYKALIKSDFFANGGYTK
jgi:hypothetical protein|tara:strand:+ start:84 stop:272 length:189 start_codon:yes stop_codon:yes gene_type:complete